MKQVPWGSKSAIKASPDDGVRYTILLNSASLAKETPEAGSGAGRKNASDCLATGRPDKRYIHLFKWPSGLFVLSSVEGNVARAYFLANPAEKPFKLTQAGGALSLHLPQKAPDEKDSVVCLVFK